MDVVVLEEMDDKLCKTNEGCNCIGRRERAHNAEHAFRHEAAGPRLPAFLKLDGGARLDLGPCVA
jgi:hypothetical protein